LYNTNLGQVIVERKRKKKKENPIFGRDNVVISV